MTDDIKNTKDTTGPDEQNGNETEENQEQPELNNSETGTDAGINSDGQAASETGSAGEKDHGPNDYPEEDTQDKVKDKQQNHYTPPPSLNDDDNGDDGDDDDDDSGAKMPFLDHLEELRWTILRSLIAVFVAAIGSYFFSEQIITLLVKPAPDLDLIYLAPTEGFMMYIKVALYSGVVIAFPVIAYQFWMFIVPGLLEQEKKYVPHIAFFTTMCFLIGAVFAYFVIIPFGLRFLLSFQTDFMTARIAIGKYLGFVVTIILVFGAVFELPILSFFLTHVGLLTPEFLKKNRRYGIVTIFIMAALLTPPDIFTQLMLAGPLILLYEISIWVSASVRRKKEREQEQEEE